MDNNRTTGAPARSARENGPLVGCLPLYPPEELVDSFGAVPVVLWGIGDRARRTPEADKHIQNYVCSVVRNVAELLFSDGAMDLSGLLFYNACDSIRNLPEILADGWALRGMWAPEVFGFHVPVAALDRPHGADYLSGEIDDLVHALERTFSADFSPDRFTASVSRYKKMRGLSRELEGLVTEGRLPFGEFCRAMMENVLLPIEQRIERLSLLKEKSEKDPVSSSSPPRKRVVLSGIHPPPPGVARMIEDAGMLVVGNDIAALSRSYAGDPDISPDPADYYVRFYRDHYPCTTLIGSADRRVDALMDLASERDAAGIIILGEKFCEYEYFEIPHLTKRLDERGVGSLILEFSAEDTSLETVRTRIEAFGEMM